MTTTETTCPTCGSHTDENDLTQGAFDAAAKCHLCRPQEDSVRGARSYKVWQNRIASGRFTKGQCQQFAHAIARKAMGYQPHGKESALTTGQCEVLLTLLQQKGGVGITDEHTRMGLDWLRSKKAQKALDDFPFDRLDSFSHFTFHGDIQVFGHYWNSTALVWRIHFTDGGKPISYYTTAWQAGDVSEWWEVDS